MSADGRRRLGSLSLGAVVAANMIGAGVFTTSGFALADLGSRGAVLGAWALGGALAVLGALCYGALGARLSESGGEYWFLSRTLSPRVGFLAGWVSIWAGFTGAIALAAEAAQSYLAPWIPEAVPPDLVGTAAILLAGALHASGVRRGAGLQTVVVAAKLALLVALVALGAARLEPTPAEPPAPAPTLGAFAVTMMWVSLSYSGWNAAVYVAGEAREPRRTLPRAMLGATLVVAALYLALNAVFVFSAPVSELAGREDVAAAAASALGGGTLELLVRATIVVALLTSVSSMTMIGPRVIARMADDGRLPRLFAFRGEVPRAAIAAQVALSIGVLWGTGLREQLTNIGWVLGAFTALSVVGLLRLRRIEGAERVPIPGHPWVPLAFVACVVALSAIALASAAGELIPALVLLASGAIVDALQRRSR